MTKLRFKEKLISLGEINSEIEKMAFHIKELSAKYNILLIPLLDGASFISKFLKDSLENLDYDRKKIHFGSITCKSYSGMRRSDVKIDLGAANGDNLANYLAHGDNPISETLVIIVDDVFDSGSTIDAVRNYLNYFGFYDIESYCLINKNEFSSPTYYSFIVPHDKFIVGFGMDYNNEFRSLPDIWEVEEDCDG